MIGRDLVAAVVRDHLPADALVVCSLGTSGRSWRQVDAPHLTYYASDPMGMAPAVALGLALARPDRTVVLLEGDGDLAMNLGVLLTIAGAAPTNLHIVVFQNGRYETGGGQPLASEVAFDVIAGGAGFPLAETARTEDEAVAGVERLLSTAGPGLLAVAVAPEAAPYPAPGAESQAERRAIFMNQLAASPEGEAT